MIHAVTYTHRSLYREQMEAMFEARHKLYVEGRGWKKLARADGKEIDQFDKENTVYLMALGSDQRLQGGLRLVPSTSPHLLKTVFPALCSGHPVPEGHHIWEISRVFVCHNDTRDEDGLLIKGKLMCAMIEFCERYGITELTSVCDTYFMPRLLEAGFDVKPLGLPQTYESGEMLGIRIKLKPGVLAKVQRSYGIPRNVLIDVQTVQEVNDVAVPLDKVASDIATFGKAMASNDLADFAEEFRYLVEELASGDARRMEDAEAALDELTEKVRKARSGRSFTSVPHTGRLQ